MSNPYGSGPPPPNNGGHGGPGPIQMQLEQFCQSHGLSQPMFHTASDRRGGRTAWSRSVEINGEIFSSRYWYDGNFLDNAQEDAAEVALQRLTNRFEDAQQRALQQQQQNQQSGSGGHSTPGSGQGGGWSGGNNGH